MREFWDNVIESRRSDPESSNVEEQDLPETSLLFTTYYQCSSFENWLYLKCYFEAIARKSPFLSAWQLAGDHWNMRFFASFRIGIRPLLWIMTRLKGGIERIQQPKCLGPGLCYNVFFLLSCLVIFYDFLKVPCVFPRPTLQVSSNTNRLSIWTENNNSWVALNIVLLS